MPRRKDDQNTQGGGAQSIKADIQSLARQLWLAKCSASEGVDWLVDGRLTTELDELSRGQLVRVERLLATSIGRARSGGELLPPSPYEAGPVSCRHQIHQRGEERTRLDRRLF